eukprot:30694-Pelagococcus_subviridis.AAC.9
MSYALVILGRIWEHINMCKFVRYETKKRLVCAPKVPQTFSARSRAFSAFAKPKSTSVTELKSYGLASTKFSSFKSRCTTPLACMYAMASSMGHITCRASCSTHIPTSVIKSTSSWPRRNSMTTCTMHSLG